MQVTLYEVDPVTGAGYCTIREVERVARSIHIDDLAVVDVDDNGEPVGVEFPMGMPNQHDDWMRLFSAMPALKEAFPTAL